MTTPGVGVLVALTFVAAVDAPERFRSSRAVGPHFGLTPKKYQSGETDHSGRISKIGDGSVRTSLYEAANVILTRPVKGSDLKAGHWRSQDVPAPKTQAGRWPASWRWCCIACSRTEPTSLLIRERQRWRLDRRRRRDRLSDGHSHQPSAARSLRRDDGWVRPLCDQQHKGDCASKIGQPVLSKHHRAAAKLRLRTEASTRRGIKLTRD